MFVPSAVSLLSALNVDSAAFENGGKIEIPGALLKLLLQIALAAAETTFAKPPLPIVR